MTLYLEDLRPGMRFTSGKLTLDAAQIKLFAASYDPQPFHLSEEGAQASLFGTLAASGWHTAALTMKLLVESLPLADGVIGAGGEISWPRPTRPGDSLHAVSEILEVTPSRSKPDRGMATIRTETLNQNGEPVQIFTSKVVLQRRPV
jgi:acyl dehydratase